MISGPAWMGLILLLTVWACGSSDTKTAADQTNATAEARKTDVPPAVAGKKQTILFWVLRQPVAVFVLELGGNDGLRGLPLRDTRQNLQAIMDTVRRKYPQATIVLAGMQIPPNLGTDYTREFRDLFKELADKNNAVLIPFLLEGVGGVAKLNQPDGIHPTPAGHKIVAETVWGVLQPLLKREV